MTEPEQQRPTARRAAVASARAAAATVGIGIAVLAIVLAVFAPLPHLSVSPPAVTVSPVATPQQLVCPGAVLQLGDAQGQGASTATAIAPTAIATGAIGATGATAGTAKATPFGTDQGSPTLVTSGGVDPSTIVAAAQSQAVSTTTVSGLAAATCAAVSTDTWLVGGSTVTGRTTLVTLANPSDVAATVALSIFDEKGAVTAPGATGIEVAPGTQRVVSLAGFAPDAAAPVVHVTSSGGHIVANLQQSVVRGLEPGGLDIVAATTGPALSLTIPGLVEATPDDVESRIAKSDDDADLATIVRLYLPGAAPATATISIAPEGSAKGQSFDQPLNPGVVTDVPIQGLTTGTYTVTVTSTAPVVGAVRAAAVSTPDSGANSSDFAWFASPTPVKSATAFSVPAGPGPTLHLANPSAAELVATVTAGDGSPQRITVPAKASVSVPVTSGATYGLVAAAPVSATISFASTAQLASVTVDPRLADAEPIVVYP